MSNLFPLTAAILVAFACTAAMPDADSADSPTAATAADPGVEQVIRGFATAVAERDTAALGVLLHEKFRVIANDYPAPGSLAELPRAAYLGAMSAGKIGGDAYEATKKYVDVQGNTAVAVYDLEAEKTIMHATFILVRSGGDGAWQIVSDAAVVEVKG